MEANELRIGNYFLPVIGEYIAMPSEKALRVGAVNKFGEVTVIEPENPTSIYRKYEGVIITEEWLIKFGFIGKSGWFYKSDLMLGYITTDNHFQTEIKFAGAETAWKVLEIKYVHQLQNLYFALTGQELTIK